MIKGKKNTNKWNKCKDWKINGSLWSWKSLQMWWLRKRRFCGNLNQVTHTTDTCATNRAAMDFSWKNSYNAYSIKVKNKIVNYEETFEYRHLIFWPGNQRTVHCHTAKPKLNQRITINQVPLSMTGPSCTNSPVIIWQLFQKWQFYWEWKLVSHIMVKTETEGVSEQGA